MLGLGIRKKLGLVLSMLVLVQLVSFGFAGTTEAADPTTMTGGATPNAAASILIEASTGTVLYAHNADEARPPASMAKMMTEYIILNKIKSGAIKWTDTVTISSHAAAIGGSGQLLAAGETYTVQDLFKDLSIDSANDAATALAEYIGGNVETFAKLMNKTAKQIGLQHAYYIDPTGLDRSDLIPTGYNPSSLPGETTMSARDCAMLARRMILDHPEILQYSSTTTAYLKPNNPEYFMLNWNHMLEGWKQYKNGNNLFAQFAYDGMDGLKTGTTDRAGACFTGTAERNGMRLISVVMGVSEAGKLGGNQRFVETRKLMDYGFNSFEKRTILTGKSTVNALKEVPVKKGVELQVPVVTGSGIEAVVNKNMKDSDVKMTATPLPADQIVAPIHAGQVLGKLQVTYQLAGQPQTQEVNLVAASDVKRASWFTLMMRSIGDFFHGLFKGMTHSK